MSLLFFCLLLFSSSSAVTRCGVTSLSMMTISELRAVKTLGYSTLWLVEHIYERDARCVVGNKHRPRCV